MRAMRDNQIIYLWKSSVRNTERRSLDNIHQMRLRSSYPFQNTNITLYVVFFIFSKTYTIHCIQTSVCFSQIIFIHIERFISLVSKYYSVLLNHECHAYHSYSSFRKFKLNGNNHFEKNFGTY